MSSEACKGCGEAVHDIDEHIESSDECRAAYPEETKALRDLGIIKEEPMNQHDAPIGTIATIGHPANNVLIRKYANGWRYLHNDKPVDDEQFRGGWDIAEQPPRFQPGAGRPDLDMLYNLLQMIELGEPPGHLRRVLVFHLQTRQDDSETCLRPAWVHATQEAEEPVRKRQPGDGCRLLGQGLVAHVDCNDYAPGTITNSITGEVVSRPPHTS